MNKEQEAREEAREAAWQAWLKSCGVEEDDYCKPDFDAGFAAGQQSQPWIEIKSEDDNPSDGYYWVTFVAGQSDVRLVGVLALFDGHWIAGEGVTDFTVLAYQVAPPPFTGGESK